MKKITLLFLVGMVLTGCVKHEEIAFEGIVVGTRNCTSGYADSNPGFLVQLTSPDSIGATLRSTDGQHMDHVIVLYEPPRRIMVEDRIHGTFYLDDKYSKSHCSIVWDDVKLPEGVFLDLVVD